MVPYRPNVFTKEPWKNLRIESIQWSVGSWLGMNPGPTPAAVRRADRRSHNSVHSLELLLLGEVRAG